MTGNETWRPPSSALRETEGIWSPIAVSEVSYPDDGNEVCFQIEESSFWFGHRNFCINEVIDRFPPEGEVFDIGGGNGFVSMALQDHGWEVVLVEPGSGANNAKRRGVQRIVRATLEDADFEAGMIPAACAFDVIEHIENDTAFLTSLYELLKPGGMLYLTVPAYQWLWSQDDINAGHYRRYNKALLTRSLADAGFRVAFVSAFFGWLVAPLFFLRSLPYRISGNRDAGAETLLDTESSHSLPGILEGIVGWFHKRERLRLGQSRDARIGTSLICVAEKPR